MASQQNPSSSMSSSSSGTAYDALDNHFAEICRINVVSVLADERAKMEELRQENQDLKSENAKMQESIKTLSIVVELVEKEIVSLRQNQIKQNAKIEDVEQSLASRIVSQSQLVENFKGNISKANEELRSEMVTQASVESQIATAANALKIEVELKLAKIASTSEDVNREIVRAHRLIGDLFNQPAIRLAKTWISGQYEVLYFPNIATWDLIAAGAVYSQHELKEWHNIRPWIADNMWRACGLCSQTPGHNCEHWDR